MAPANPQSLTSALILDVITFGMEDTILNTLAFRSFQISHETNMTRDARPLSHIAVDAYHVVPPIVDAVEATPVGDVHTGQTHPSLNLRPNAYRVSTVEDDVCRPLWLPLA